MDEWIKKMWFTYTTAYSARKKEGNPAICNNTDGPRGHYTMCNKSEKDEYRVISLTCATVKKQTKTTELADTEHKLVVARGQGVGREGYGQKDTDFQF